MFVNRSAIRLQIGQAFRAIVPGAFRGTCAGVTDKLNCHGDVIHRLMGSLGSQLGRSSIHSSSQKEFENGTGQMTRSTGQMTRSMDFVRGIMEEDIKGFPRNNNNNWMPQYQVENNADILHIRMMRNNSKVTLTDSKGKVKFNISAGMLSGATKVSRYSAESASELAGRKIREMGIKSVVVKVNGFTFFKKKRQAILAVREGYTNNRGDKNPIVFIEDTTRKAHNGCRLPKQRRT
ncbi:probable ribosomal protein S11, mitochondrial [Impatiens glandulifera]|uniref:probable ribosomal protein S11, mitochondrial n=1 Tax=Impatiens glandulifera TaxID=253017 RepID=UPI001FB1914B|nr:probable ribosomal protein S11, mitochondrial [Impatiens glandulifera]XP_047333550.1 probable ribosomal protein S11, mitochondrial [Impatiens glandulifera]